MDVLIGTKNDKEWKRWKLKQMNMGILDFLLRCFWGNSVANITKRKLDAQKNRHNYDDYSSLNHDCDYECDCNHDFECESYSDDYEVNDGYDCESNDGCDCSDYESHEDSYCDDECDNEHEDY